MSGRTPEREPSRLTEAGPALAEQDAIVVEKTDDVDDAAAQKAADAAGVEAAIAELWRDFKGSADPRLRERLILHYSPLVKYVAGRGGGGFAPQHQHGEISSHTL